MKFNGTILITDPCYCIEKDWRRFYNLFIENRPKKLQIDYKKIESYQGFINYLNFSMELNGKKSSIENKIEELKYLIEELKKEENLVYGDDETKQAVNFLSEFGFSDCICGDTLYGDWSCSVYNSDTKESIGQFCADAGLFFVAYLEEILKYNPSYNFCQEKNSGNATIIENFCGEIRINVNEKNEGKNFSNLEIIGNGNTNFIATQTGI